MVRKFPNLPQLPKDVLPARASRSLRKQIFLPSFTIALIRTPFLPPRFASFYVPLSFNKLDLRDYLYRVYGVKVLSIRSFVEQQGITRQRRNGQGYGPLRRPKSKKKMTVEMIEPFVWPDSPTDLSPWESDSYYRAEEYGDERRKKISPDAGKEPDTKERESVEKQAQELRERKQVWKPTWQAVGLNYDRPIFSAGTGKGSSGKSES